MRQKRKQVISILVQNLHTINRELAAAPAAFAARADAEYDERLLRVAKDIYARREEHPVILISGPSGSGKTTTALKLEALLDSWGCEAHTLSMDNYFHPFDPEQRERAARGEIDLESPARVDAELLSSQLQDVIQKKPVPLPKYDFTTSQRVYPGAVLERKSGDLVIVEGIHALNHDVVQIPDEQSARLYISVRTRVTDGEILLHPAKIRLLRRMVRDRLYRNRSVEETLRLYASVQRGEGLYIMPHKRRATHEIDTFFAYEIGAYRPLLLQDLLKLEEELLAPMQDLVQILREAEPVPEACVPRGSMIREFIGNGQFSY